MTGHDKLKDTKGGAANFSALNLNQDFLQKLKEDGESTVHRTRCQQAQAPSQALSGYVVPGSTGCLASLLRPLRSWHAADCAVAQTPHAHLHGSAGLPCDPGGGCVQECRCSPHCS